MAAGSIAGDPLGTSMRKRGQVLGSANGVAVEQAEVDDGNGRFAPAIHTKLCAVGAGARAPGLIQLAGGSSPGVSTRDFESPPDVVTCFELDTHRPPEALSVYRLSRVRGVEIWSISGCQRQRLLLSDLCSASLVLGPSGQGCRVRVGGEERICRAGEILLGDADEIQLTTPLEAPSSFFTIFWPHDALEQIARELGIIGLPPWNVTLLESEPISGRLVELRGLLESGAAAASIEQAYRDVTCALLRQNGLSPPARSCAARHPRVRRAVERLRSGFAETLSLAALASEVQLSKYHLAHCFRKACGVAPHRYQKLLRVQSARRLLERGFSVTDAANETGFSDAPHLSRAFREALGVSPGAWANAWRASDPCSTRTARTMPPPDYP